MNAGTFALAASGLIGALMLALIGGAAAALFASAKSSKGYFEGLERPSAFVSRPDAFVRAQPPLPKPSAPREPTERGDLREADWMHVAAAVPTGLADAASDQIFERLNGYYLANISQSATIFWASLISTCIGFLIVFAGVVLANTNTTTAIISAIAGALSQFIAATFLVVLRSTQAQATTYAQTLVELRLRDVARKADDASVELGLRLLAEISADRTNPANATKAAIALGLMVKQSTIVEPPAVNVEVPADREPITERRNRSGTVTFEDAGVSERR